MTPAAAASTTLTPPDSDLDEAAKDSPFHRGPKLDGLLTKYLGDRHGDVFWDGSLDEQITDAIDVPNDPRRLADGNILVSGQRLKDGRQEGAVLLSKEGQILGLAGITYEPGCEYNCASSNTLTVITDGPDKILGDFLIWSNGKVSKLKRLTVESFGPSVREKQNSHL